MDERHRMDASVLDEMIAADSFNGLKPWLIVASAGTTDTGAVDPFLRISAIAKKHEIWLHIDAAFDRVVCGDEAPTRKPDPSHLRACLPDDMTDFSQVVVVGDSPNDVKAARALGAMSVGCLYGLGTPGLVRSAQPNFLIEEVGELARLFPSR